MNFPIFDSAVHFLRRLPAAVAVLCLALATLTFTSLILATPSQAIPSFARQTGQPCAACHTAFPELTPFGRRFKLGGYTLEGGDSKIPPFAVMEQATITKYLKSIDAPPSPNNGYGTNNFVDPYQQVSVFYGGKIYGNLGAFSQTTFQNSYTKSVSLDLTDIRYADTAKFGKTDVVWGITANNAPGVQDVWNTTPQWNFPYIKSAFALTPTASTLIEGFGSSQTGGVGAYAFANDMYYAELSGYASLPSRWQTTLGVSPPDPTNTIAGIAPYWRLAVEPTWGDHSLMVGTFGMAANIRPGNLPGVGTDKITDIGIDTQYQWISDLHAITARASYVYEHQKLNASGPASLGNSVNGVNHLSSVKASISYIYDHTYSVTAGYALLTGSTDALWFGSGSSTGSASPNSQSYSLDVAYMPFSKGAPGPWPWLNTRVGSTYTWNTKLDGVSKCIGCRSARDNNTMMFYAFTAF